MIIEPLIVIDSNTKEAEPISDYKDLVVKNGINAYEPLTFYLHKTEANQHAFVLIENENFIEFEGHQYRIKQSYEQLRGNTPVKFVTNARHRIYDLLDIYRHNTLTTGAKSINEVLSFIFNGTRWTFAVIDPFPTVEFENFGNENCLELFNKVIERYGAEFDIIGTEIRISLPKYSLIDMQFRHNHNIKTFRKNIDTNNLSTRIKGTGKLNEDGTPVVEAEYISPNASLYTDDNGNIEYRDAPPYSNETITHQATLVEHLKAAIQDTPDVSFELEFSILQDAGYTKPIPEKGDVIPTILEELNVDVDLKIMEIERYPNTNRSPKVALGSVRKDADDQLIDYQKSLLDKIWDENKKAIRYNVYDEAVKRATEMLNNSLTELEYPPGMGIIARDPNDPNKFVAFRSSGIGITQNNGVSFSEAITSLGVTTSLLTAGQIHTNNIQIIGNSNLFYWDGNYLIAIDANDPNKFVRLNSSGLYIAKGALTIERPDGAVSTQNGIPRNSLVVQQSSPTFRGDNITEAFRYFRSKQSDYDFIGAYQMNHDGRYLKIDGYVLVGTAGVGVVVQSYAGGKSFYQVNTIAKDVNATEGKQFYIIIDLGTPTYTELKFYIKMRSDNAPAEGGCRINWVTQYG